MRINEVHHVLETLTNSLSILFNGILLYLIYKHSTYRITVYKALLTTDATLDFVLGIIILNAQPVCLTGEQYLIMFSGGFFAGRSANFDAAILTAFAFVLHVNVIWIPVQFFYRYIFLCCPEKKLKAYAVGIVSVLWNCLAFVVIRWMFTPRDDFQPEAVHIMDINEWPRDADEPLPHIFGAKITCARLIAWESLWFTSSGVGAIVVFICEHKIVKHFDGQSAVHSRTREIHREFHRALMAMAICPLITTAIPIFYFIVTICMSFCPAAIGAFMSTAVTSITMFNPITTVVFMRCYREAVLKVFRKRRTVPFPTGTTVFTSALSAATHNFDPIPAVRGSEAVAESRDIGNRTEKRGDGAIPQNKESHFD